jgi:uncharacterized protein (TIGR03435 family)
MFFCALGAFAQGAAPQSIPGNSMPQTFDVVSIRSLADQVLPEIDQRLGHGCDGGFPKVEHNRFTVETTLYALISWAYGFNKNGGCSYVNFAGLITGGPDWLRSQRFHIEALMPPGAPDYTTAQFLAGTAPGLEMMIRKMLNDRFGLVLHQAKVNASVYVLSVAGKGPKPSAQDGATPFLRGRPGPDQTISIQAEKVTMGSFALFLTLQVHEAVIDETGLTGGYDMQFNFAPGDSANSSGPSVFTALQDTGLKLAAGKRPIEAIIVDHAEKPSEN